MNVATKFVKKIIVARKAAPLIDLTQSRLTPAATTKGICIKKRTSNGNISQKTTATAKIAQT
jgi:hypothetical protein